MLYQQGDVLIESLGPDEKMPTMESMDENRRNWRGPVKQFIASRGDTLQLAEGETVGHTHRITVDTVAEGADAEMLQQGQEIFLRILRGEATVIHEEHGPVPLPPGEYKVRKVREYDPFTRRTYNVVD